MTVNVNFYTREVTPNAKNGPLEVADGATVADMMATAAEKYGGFVENYNDYVIFMVNAKAGQLNTVLCEGDKINVLRRIFGG